MRYVLFARFALFSLPAVLSFTANGRCQLGGGSSIIVHDFGQYGRSIVLGRYAGTISGIGIPTDCPHANERLKSIATVAGKPKGGPDAGLTESESQKRKQLFRALIISWNAERRERMICMICWTALWCPG